jgi:flagellar motor switch protein FliM
MGQTVQVCNFRAAGRMSNEMVRGLTAMHEQLARNLASSLDLYMGGEPKVKLEGLDQLAVKEHVAATEKYSFLAPFSVSPGEGAVVVEIDAALVFPMIDLLLGGVGGAGRDARDLSEIEEEVLQELATVIVRQAEAAWGMTAGTLTANPRVDADGLAECFPPGEKVTLVKLEVEVAELTGMIQLAFPASFAGTLVKQKKLDPAGKKTKVRQFPAVSLRERILDCDFNVAADLPGMRVTVRDLIGLQPGCVLKLRAPVRNPGMLTVGGREIFESVPVRNGTQKAAQVGRRVQMTSWGKE